MPYCSRCGVEVGADVEFCPLCRTPIQKLPPETDAPVYPKGEKPAVPAVPVVDPHRVYLVWMVITVILFTPFFVILTLGIQQKSLGIWAGYPLLSIGAAWIASSLLLFFRSNPLIYGPGLFLTAGGLLLLFDRMDGHISWFLPVGLPLLLLASVLIAAVVLLSLRMNPKGWNIAGIMLLASGVFCLGMDISITRFLSGSWMPSWSLIVVSAFVPLAAFLLVVHYLLKKRANLRRFLHL